MVKRLSKQAECNDWTQVVVQELFLLRIVSRAAIDWDIFPPSVKNLAGCGLFWGREITNSRVVEWKCHVRIVNPSSQALETTTSPDGRRDHINEPSRSHGYVSAAGHKRDDVASCPSFRPHKDVGGYNFRAYFPQPRLKHASRQYKPSANTCSVAPKTLASEQCIHT